MKKRIKNKGWSIDLSQDDDSATKQVLELIGLAHDEVDTYYKITGRGPVMVGEIALIAEVSEERASEIAENLFHKGLLKQIPGKVPIYETLPPYAALVNQIHQFKEKIKEFGQVAPKNLQERFESLGKQSVKLKKLDDYRIYLQLMKTKLPAQIKTQFDRFDAALDQVKRFQDVKKFILNLKEIVPSDITKEFEVMESRLEIMKTEISNKFEKQFRIGALKSMAEKIVSRVISVQFREITEYFKKKFVETTQRMLDQVINQLGSLTDTAGEISTDLSTIFVDIDAGIKTTLTDLENRVSAVYDDILTGIQELQDVFQKEIFETLQNDIIDNIIGQLESAEITMNEFWERSKQASLLSFKDVWFVRSVEGVKAQINELVSRVKMRVHITAPKLSDIDLIALSQLKKHINIRISTNFDLNNPEDQIKFQQLEDIPNITIRLYPIENLWAINKDFEEVVVCVVSKKGEGEFEIAGMGSVLEEHVKLFAGVLEDVWIQSKRFDQAEMMQAIKRASVISSTEQLISIPTEAEIVKKIEPIPSTISPKPITAPKKEIEPSGILQEAQRIEKISVEVPPNIIPSSPSSSEASISTQFDDLMNNFENMTGNEIALILEKLQDEILETKGFNAALRQIRMSSSKLKRNMNLLNSAEKEELFNKLGFWREKLNL